MPLLRTLSLITGLMFLYVSVGPVLGLSLIQNITLILSGLAISAFVYWLLNKTQTTSFVNKVTIIHIFLFSLALRITWILLSSNIQTSDFLAYHNMALDIMHGDYIFHPFRPTGTSIITSLFYSTFGVGQFSALIPIGIVSSACIALIYFITRDLFGKNAAVISALFMAVLPEHLFYVNLIGTDVYFSFLILLGIFFLCRDEEISLKCILISGVCFGLSQYIRPTGFLAIASVIIFLALLLLRTNTSKFTSHALAMVFIFLLTISPIIYFNYTNINTISISPSQIAGWSMLLSTNPVYKEKYNTEDQELLNNEISKRKNKSNVNKYVFANKVAKELAIQRILDGPFTYIFNSLVYKPLGFWARPSLGWCFEGIENKGIRNTLYSFGVLFHRVCLFLTAFVFLFPLNKDWLKHRHVYFFMLFTLIVSFSHLFVEIQPRYHHVLLPLFSIIIGRIASNTQHNHKDSRS